MFIDVYLAVTNIRLSRNDWLRRSARAVRSTRLAGEAKIRKALRAVALNTMAQQQQLTEQEIIATYRGMRSEIKQLAEKMSELEMEVNEHQRVLETLEPLSPTRKAYRKIGGVLIERTVREVKPAISKKCRN